MSGLAPVKPPSAFSPLALPMQWSRMHVEGKDELPGEAECPCGRPSLLIGNDLDLRQLSEDFPPVGGVVVANVPSSVKAKAQAAFVCFFCERGAVVTI